MCLWVSVIDMLDAHAFCECGFVPRRFFLIKFIALAVFFSTNTFFLDSHSRIFSRPNNGAIFSHNKERSYVHRFRSDDDDADARWQMIVVVIVVAKSERSVVDEIVFELTPLLVELFPPSPIVFVGIRGRWRSWTTLTV